MLRLGAFLGLAFAVIPLAAGAPAATSKPKPPVAALYGEWHPDTTSSSQVASDTVSVDSSDEQTARGVTGANSINFDVYCKSTNSGVEPVTYFTVATTSFSTFGGCISGKTDGHLYTWDTVNGVEQVWYAHLATLKGEPVLDGNLEIEPAGGPNTTYKFRGHHPAVKFLAHVKFTTILGKHAKHAAELTTMTGAGEIHVFHVPNPCASADTTSLVSGSGAIAVKSVKIGGPKVVELDSLTVKLDTDQTGSHSTFSCDYDESLKAVDVTVTKSDPAEKDACRVGASGSLWLLDGSGGGPDGVKLDIPKCGVALTFSSKKAKKGSHVAVAETLDENGY